jgi:Fic family protein
MRRLDAWPAPVGYCQIRTYLVNAYITREAVASSRIEGTQASVTEVFDADVSGVSARDDVREVRNYLTALRHGLKRLADDFPVSLRLIKEMHELLLANVRGQDKTPGEFRRSQNWISSPDNRPSTARFVPPTVDNMWTALDDWEKYLHDEEPRLPLLVRCALLHYQFETIHPFLARAALHRSLSGEGRLATLTFAIPIKLLRRAEGRILRSSAVRSRARRDSRVA